MNNIFFQALKKALNQSLNTCVNRRAQLLAGDIRRADRNTVEFEALRKESKNLAQVQSFGQANAM